MSLRRGRIACAVASLCLAAPLHAAKSVRLQTIDLSDRGMSSEGGEAILYRVIDGKSIYCRIAVVHFGETGKTTLGFAFNPRLFSAVQRNYDYATSVNLDPRAKIVRVRVESLKTKAGAATLPAAFPQYRSLFDSRKLRACARP